MPLSGRASNTSVPYRSFASWRAARPAGPWPDKLTIIGPFARKVMSLSALTAAGQATFVIALPVLSRLYTPADFGIFTIYLSIVNIGGPIIGLKFESALYAGRTREEAAATLSLSFLTTLITSSTVTIALFFFGGLLATQFGPAARTIVWMLPIGLLLAGMWSLSSAWAIKSEAVSTLGVARFAQPALMTALQLAAGVIHPAGGVALIGAHLFSHLAYTTFILGKTLHLGGISGRFRPVRWSGVLRHANAQRHFPLFLLPAEVSYLAVSNLPPLLLSSFYGAEVAGHCGVAYRIVTAPLAIASLPFGGHIHWRSEPDAGPHARGPARAQGVSGQPAACIYSDLAVRRRRACNRAGGVRRPLDDHRLDHSRLRAHRRGAIPRGAVHRNHLDLPFSGASLRNQVRVGDGCGHRDCCWRNEPLERAPNHLVMRLPAP